jgi:RHS repeat-associated protein
MVITNSQIQNGSNVTLQATGGLRVVAGFNSNGATVLLKAGATGGGGGGTTSQRFYYLTDHLGSVRVTLTEAGNVDSWSDYYPFGKEARGSSTANRPKEQFTGKERDTEIGLDYFGARYYNADIGRWLNTDPLNQYSSPYVYVGNNPLGMIDPTGMAAVHSASAINAFDSRTSDWQMGISRWQSGSGNDREDEPKEGDNTDDAVEEVSVNPYSVPGSGGIMEDDTPFDAVMLVTGIGQAAWGLKSLKSGKDMLYKGLRKLLRGGSTEVVDWLSKSALKRASQVAFEAAEDFSSIVIKPKHMNIGSGHFAKFATQETNLAKKWVQQALRSQNAIFASNPQKENTFQVITDLGIAIGTKGQTAIKIVLDYSGKMITAYPVNLK